MRKIRLFLRGKLFLATLAALCLFAVGVLLSVWLPRALMPIAALERLFSLIVSLLVAGDRTPSEHKISKLVLLVCLPWTGAILCLIFRSSAPVTEFDGGMSENPSLMARAGELSRRLCGLGACALESAEYLPLGQVMQDRLLLDLTIAKKYIWLQYYIIEEGVFWGSILSLLEKKAEEGVDVRLIYDDFGCTMRLSRHYGRILAAHGIKSCIARPVRLKRAAGRRNHRKIAVIDGEIAYTGGINLADEYIGEKIRFGHWKDTAIRVTGGCAGRFAELFSRCWNAEAPSDMVCPSVKNEGTMSAVVLSDVADETELRAGQQLLLLLIRSARERLYLNTPYLSPDAPIMAALKGAALSGVDVRLMIPHIPDKKLPFLLTRSYARELQRAGVQVREYTAGFLHAKSVLSDGYSFVSSYNLDFRSLYLQAECGVLVDGKDTAEALRTDFLAAWETGTPLPRARRTTRATARILRLFAPLM